VLTSLLAIVCFVSLFHSFADLVALFGCCSSVVLQRKLLHTLVLEHWSYTKATKASFALGIVHLPVAVIFGELVLVLFWSLWLHILDLISATPFSSFNCV